ncbi:MAG TPA: DUF4349 domain-containing protein [Holophagaceae bacterium]|nr:DUF4349 domain-containing protein [Holophagaceae bacterium]
MRAPFLDRFNARSSKAWAMGGTCVVLGLVALGSRHLSAPIAGLRLQKTVGVDLSEQAYAPEVAAPIRQPAGAGVDLALKRIQKATLVLEVTDLAALRREVGATTGALGGYVASSRVEEGGGGQGPVSMNLQIPSGRFEEALVQLAGKGKVLAEQRSVEDITRAYVDLEARLRNKRVSQARLRDILATRTGRIADVVEAEQALSAVTEEIERMEAQRRVYDHEVAFGVVDLTLRLRPVAAPVPPWWAPVREGLRASWESLLGSALALTQILAVLLPWGLLLSPLALRLRRKARLHSQPQA